MVKTLTKQELMVLGKIGKMVMQGMDYNSLLTNQEKKTLYKMYGPVLLN